MNADSMIDALASDFGPVRPARLNWLPIVFGSILVAFAVAVLWGVRPNMVAALQSAALWAKCGYTAAVAATALILVRSLGKPGADCGQALFALLLTLGIAVAGAALVLAGTNPLQRVPSVLGKTWPTCSLSIFALSLLTTPMLLVASRAFAPVRRVAAGATLGIAGGAIAATGYGLLYCAESSLVFIGLWYTLGILASGLAGAAFGRVALYW